MSDYIPREADVRRAYINTFGWMKKEKTIAEALKEFDLWLNRERAKVWDDCLDAVAAQGTVQLPDNPYKEQE